MKNRVMWIRMLTIIFLSATFEHAYHTLMVFSADMKLFGLNISRITNVLMVMGIDLTVYFGVKGISEYSNKASLAPLKALIGIMTLVSIALNNRYMLTYSPSEFGLNFDTIISITVGTLISLTIVILAWAEGIYSKVDNSKQIATKSNGKNGNGSVRKKTSSEENEKLKQIIRAKIAENPSLSQRAIANELGIPQSRVSRLLRE